MQTFISSKLLRTSSLVIAASVMPFIIAEYLRRNASNQPHLRGRPVVAPNSAPTCLSFSPVSSSSSVGKGPFPTRVVYAFTIPYTRFIFVGGIPVPVHAPPEEGLDEVTKGYVP